MLREKNRSLNLKTVHWPESSDPISSNIDKSDQLRIYLTWCISIHLLHILATSPLTVTIRT